VGREAGLVASMRPASDFRCKSVALTGEIYGLVVADPVWLTALRTRLVAVLVALFAGFELFVAVPVCVWPIPPVPPLCDVVCVCGLVVL
jgi:hypothetical protein